MQCTTGSEYFPCRGTWVARIWGNELNGVDESEAWKGLRTAVTSLAPAGRGVWGPGTQKPQGTYAFWSGFILHRTTPRNRKSWIHGIHVADGQLVFKSLCIIKWTTDPGPCLSLMSISLLVALLRGMAYRMGVSASCLWIAQKDLDQPGP